METINGREYKVTKTEALPNLKADLMRRGWDGYYYHLTGKRGATYIAFRSVKGGELQIIAGAR